MTGRPQIWLTTRQFAAAAGISRINAHKALARCLAGGEWRGHRLVVSAVRGNVGRAGLSYRVRLDSLPPELQERARVHSPELASGTLETALAEPGCSTPAGRQNRRRVTRRADHGAERLLFLRRAFEGAGIADDAAREKIEAELDLRVKRLWAAGLPGWRSVARYAEQDLHELLREAGAELPDAELYTLCQVPRSYVSRWSRRKHRATHTFLNDAKALHDAMPAIRRERPSSPLQVLVGDGTALDIRILRPDGTEWKVWLILWLDMATGRLFGNPYARPKGGGVRQEHVAASFACLATAIGLPEVVLIDRGSEYGWADRLESAGLCRVIRALPYNARAKPIEPAIRVFNAHYLSQIPGYIGADRLRKKSQSVGRPAAPFPAGPQALFAAINQAVDLYNATPQPALGNRSPFDLWQAAVDRGWRPTRIDPATAEEALVRVETRTVRQGAVRIGGAAYTSDELCYAVALEGASVTVHRPLCEDFPPAVYAPDGRFVSLVHPSPSYAFTDPAGASEAGRLKQLRRQGARDLARGAPPAELPAYQATFLERYGPGSDAIAGEVVELDGERGRAAAARRQGGKGRAEPATLPAPEDDFNPGWMDMVRKMEAGAVRVQEEAEAEEERLRARAREMARKYEGRTGT